MTGVDIRPLCDFLLACLPELAAELPALVRQFSQSDAAKAFGILGGEVEAGGWPPKCAAGFVTLKNRRAGEQAWFPADKLAEFVLTQSRVKREAREELLERMRKAWLKSPETFRKLTVEERG